jgi:hypothetical protein
VIRLFRFLAGAATSHTRGKGWNTTASRRTEQRMAEGAAAPPPFALIRCSSSAVPHPLFPIRCSSLPVPHPLFPIRCSPSAVIFPPLTPTISPRSPPDARTGNGPGSSASTGS